MGDLEKMRTRLSKRYFFELRTGNGTATPKSGPVSLRSDGRQGSKPASRRSARASLRVLDCLPRFGFSPFMGEAGAPPPAPEKRQRTKPTVMSYVERLGLPKIQRTGKHIGGTEHM